MLGGAGGLGNPLVAMLPKESSLLVMQLEPAAAFYALLAVALLALPVAARVQRLLLEGPLGQPPAAGGRGGARRISAREAEPASEAEDAPFVSVN